MPAAVPTYLTSPTRRQEEEGKITHERLRGADLLLAIVEKVNSTLGGSDCASFTLHRSRRKKAHI